MEAPKVDIYVPTYRPHADHLQSALDSVSAQTEQNFHIHINDEPTDIDTEEIARKYLGDPRVTFARNETRLGIGGNWNACLQHGNAPFIQFMFQDDVWKPHYLESALRVLKENPSVGFVSLEHEYVLEGNVPTENVYTHVKEFLKAHITEGKKHGIDFLLWWLEHGLHPNVIGEPMFVMMRRSVVKQVGFFDEKMQQNLDSEYWARMLLQTDWYFVPGNHGSFRVHFDSASMRNQKQKKGIFDRYRILKKIVSLLPSEHRAKGKQILKEQTRAMAQKFFERYGPGGLLRYEHSESIANFALKHPMYVLNSFWRYLH